MPVHELQSFSYDSPLVVGESYDLSVTMGARRRRRAWSSRRYVASLGGEPCARIETMLRLVPRAGFGEARHERVRRIKVRRGKLPESVIGPFDAPALARYAEASGDAIRCISTTPWRGDRACRAAGTWHEAARRFEPMLEGLARRSRAHCASPANSCSRCCAARPVRSVRPRAAGDGDEIFCVCSRMARRGRPASSAKRRCGRGRPHE